ncbi:hypothetical protein EDB19DRAFT_1329514 [Suillus lakei]|nr:hypothetical protein EDB19DRAFT_1329514 [Suillus lakei]
MTTNNKTNAAKNGNGGGGGFGKKLKGAAQVIHGIGENIRGTALGTADRATSSVAGVEKNAEVATKGRAEVAEGMARMKGHAPAPQVAPAGTTPGGTAPPGTVPTDREMTAGTGTGTGAGTGSSTGAAVGGTTAAGAGVTGQGQRQGTRDEKISTTGAKSGPEASGSGAAQTGRETASGIGTVHEQKGPSKAAAGAGVVSEQKQRDSGAGSQQEGKRDDRNIPQRSQSGNTGQTRAPDTVEGHPLQTGERSSQQRVDERCSAGQMGHQQEDGQQGRWVRPGEGRCGQIRFQGISMDEGGEQMAEKPREAGQIHHEGVQQEGGQQEPCAGQGQGGRIQFQDFQGCGL